MKKIAARASHYRISGKKPSEIVMQQARPATLIQASNCRGMAMNGFDSRTHGGMDCFAALAMTSSSQASAAKQSRTAPGTLERFWIQVQASSAAGPHPCLPPKGEGVKNHAAQLPCRALDNALFI